MDRTKIVIFFRELVNEVRARTVHSTDNANVRVLATVLRGSGIPFDGVKFAHKTCPRCSLR